MSGPFYFHPNIQPMTGKTPIKIARFLLLALLLSFSLSAHEADAELMRQEKFRSPKGIFMVVITELSHKKYTKEEMLEGALNVSNVLYRVDFIPSGALEPLATINYTDVYGWDNGSAPARMKDIFQSFTWSPYEDYVIVPEEGWAGAPGTSTSRLVSLNPEFPWTEKKAALENIAWINDLSFMGDYHNDCDYGVAWFDGKDGRLISIKESESPLGYELVSVKGNIATIRMVLDNCRMQDLPPRCLIHDLSTGREEHVACPRAKPKKQDFP